jgi:hypothetical protein
MRCKRHIYSLSGLLFTAAGLLPPLATLSQSDASPSAVEKHLTSKDHPSIGDFVAADMDLVRKVDGEKILMIKRWEPDDHHRSLVFYCVVSGFENDDATDKHSLRIYRKQDEKLIPQKIIPADKFRDGEDEMEPRYVMDWVENIKEERVDNSTQIAIWHGGGVGVNMTVFAYLDDQIKIVFEGGGRAYPEFLSAGDHNIIVDPDDEYWNDHYNAPLNAGLYRWNGKSYTLIRKVPWEKRYLALDHLERLTHVKKKKKPHSTVHH